jgi:hypothetical protein
VFSLLASNIVPVTSPPPYVFSHDDVLVLPGSSASSPTSYCVQRASNPHASNDTPSDAQTSTVSPASSDDPVSIVVTCCSFPYCANGLTNVGAYKIRVLELVYGKKDNSRRIVPYDIFFNRSTPHLLTFCWSSLPLKPNPFELLPERLGCS